MWFRDFLEKSVETINALFNIMTRLLGCILVLCAIILIGTAVYNIAGPQNTDPQNTDPQNIVPQNTAVALPSSESVIAGRISHSTFPVEVFTDPDTHCQYYRTAWSLTVRRGADHPAYCN